MNIYLLENETYPLDNELKATLTRMDYKSENIYLPFPKDDNSVFFPLKEGGIIFIPAIWTDLGCIKTIQDIKTCHELLVPLIVGPEPSPTHLIAAFHEGLCGYLKTPFNDEELKLVLTRANTCYKENKQYIFNKSINDNNNDNKGNGFHSEMSREYNKVLAQAFQEIINQKGPFFHSQNSVKVLLAISSKAQQKQLANYLKKLHVSTIEIESVEEAINEAKNEKTIAVISDSIFQDCPAALFASKLKKSLKKEVPCFIVWTSSNEKTSLLSDPENGVDKVILKTDSHSGMDSIFLSLLISLYQTM